MKKTKNKQKKICLKKNHVSKHSLQGNQKKQEKTEQNANFRNFKLTKKHFFYN